MRPRLPSTRLSGALAVALLLVVTFAGKLHEALVPHTICAEHGESVELSHGASTRIVHDLGSREPVLSDASKSRTSSHEHCAVALLGRSKELLGTRPVEMATLSANEPRVSLELGMASTEQSVPLLLLAPKHSPPAIA